MFLHYGQHLCGVPEHGELPVQTAHLGFFFLQVCAMLLLETLKGSADGAIVNAKRGQKLDAKTVTGAAADRAGYSRVGRLEFDLHGVTRLQGNAGVKSHAPCADFGQASGNEDF